MSRSAESGVVTSTPTDEADEDDDDSPSYSKSEPESELVPPPAAEDEDDTESEIKSRECSVGTVVVVGVEKWSPASKPESELWRIHSKLVACSHSAVIVAEDGAATASKCTNEKSSSEGVGGHGE